MDPQQRVDEAYSKALLRKRLFKEYMSSHKIMDAVNLAVTGNWLTAPEASGSGKEIAAIKHDINSQHDDDYTSIRE